MNPRSPTGTTATRTRAAMWLLLALVAASAAVLSFAAQRDLARLCGFSDTLSPLLPLVVDAGAAAGCLVWLGVDAPKGARAYARALTILLLASSIAGNAVEHYLTAYALRPSWGLVVGVSGVAPTILGAVTHLAVLVAQGTTQAVPALVAEPVRKTAPKTADVKATVKTPVKTEDDEAKAARQKELRRARNQKYAAKRREQQAAARKTSVVMA